MTTRHGGRGRSIGGNIVCTEWGGEETCRLIEMAGIVVHIFVRNKPKVELTLVKFYIRNWSNVVERTPWVLFGGSQAIVHTSLGGGTWWDAGSVDMGVEGVEK